MGKLVVNNNTATSLNEYRAQVRAVAVAVLILFALVSALLLWRVRRRILTPFHRLESFASSIAAGNLDIPLAMDRANVFGAFTESFDLMRSELAAAREGERRATQSKKELAAQLSHDIRSPVASIKAVSELMQVSKVDAASRERAAIIEAKADQIDLLVGNMLNATLEELTELVISPTETPSSAIASLIERADYRRLLRGSADDATGGAASAVVVPPCLVTADPIRLEQTLDNIINNSYKYAGTPIAFEAEILDCYLWLSFTDAGPGVSPDELPLLTQKFYRGANAAAKSGSGLGLYIANAFMARMDGSLTCENTTQGFRITLTLRLV
jgi:signal transduction histidine kinase